MTDPPPRYGSACNIISPDRGQFRGVMRFEFPGFGDDTWIRHAYWQLLLPPEEHLVVPPGELTGEFSWGWNNFYFGRQPVLSQADLEAWVGLRRPGGTPVPAGMNIYLFSSLGRIGACRDRDGGAFDDRLRSVRHCLAGGTPADLFARGPASGSSCSAAAVILGGLDRDLSGIGLDCRAGLGRLDWPWRFWPRSCGN